MSRVTHTGDRIVENKGKIKTTDDRDSRYMKNENETIRKKKVANRKKYVDRKRRCQTVTYPLPT